MTTVVHCESNCVRQAVSFTNTVTNVTCTNDYGGAAIFHLQQNLTGPIAANASCDELSAYLPTAATFNASFNTGVRQPDWRGYHTGNFTISVGTNIYAVGELYGDNGVSSHGATEPCAPCGHFEGALSGELTWLSGLPGGHIQATYAGDITGASPCSSNTPPQGPVTLYLDGVAVTTNCITPPPSSSGPCGVCQSTYQLDFDWSAVVSDQGGGCGSTGTYTNHCSVTITRNAVCTWTAASNPASGAAGGIQFITGAEVYPDIDMGDGTYYFGVTISTPCATIPNTDTLTNLACPAGSYQNAQTTSCSAGGCVHSFAVSNITVH